MEYSYRYHAYPTQEVAEELKYHIDVHRQAYNYSCITDHPFYWCIYHVRVHWYWL